MDYAVFVQFDESQMIDGLELETIQSKSIHTDDSAKLIEELGCENLELIGFLGEQRVPIYGYTGADENAFSSATGSDIGAETFKEKTKLNNDEYDEGMVNAAATHLEIIGPKKDLDCSSHLLGGVQVTAKPFA